MGCPRHSETGASLTPACYSSSIRSLELDRRPSEPLCQPLHDEQMAGDLDGAELDNPAVVGKLGLAGCQHIGRVVVAEAV